MKKIFDSKVVDSRLVERNIASGALSKKDYDAYLASLPDDANNFEHSLIKDELEDSDDDFEEEESE